MYIHWPFQYLTPEYAPKLNNFCEQKIFLNCYFIDFTEIRGKKIVSVVSSPPPPNYID